MTISLSILFDAGYIEPALVTAYELLRTKANYQKLYLLLLTNNHEDDLEARMVVASFCEQFSKEMPVVAIEIANNLSAFNTFHFNNSIIYKALIPSALPHEPYILNIDAGMLPGPLFSQFINDLNSNWCLPGADWVVGAHCSPTEDQLPVFFSKQQANKLYPAGAALLFNTMQYKKSDWHNRILKNFGNWMAELLYAEQELICLTAKEDELRRFSDSYIIDVHFLGGDVLMKKAEPLSEETLKSCTFLKFAGSFKPWKYWVLDPNKSIYTRRRRLMEMEFPLSRFSIIEKNRLHNIRPEWATEFLRAYDQYLQ